MKDSSFLKRLRSNLPIWVTNGWVLQNKQQDILQFVAEQDQKRKTSAGFIFSLLGTLLFAIGIITFFAANWDIFSKLFKLSLLFFSMWGCYLMAYLLETYQNSSATHTKISKLATFLPGTPHLFLLLGTLLFGANIWLIAQIYHIEAFYPHGVLLWSLGALLVALLLKDSLTLALSLCLGLLWTLLQYRYAYFMGGIHWAYLPLWLVQAYTVMRTQKTSLWNLTIFSLVSWSLISITSLQFNLYFVQLYFLLACTLFLLSKIILRNSIFPVSEKIISSTLHWGIFLVFSSLFALSIPNLIMDLQTEAIINQNNFYPAELSVNFTTTLLVILLNFFIVLLFLITQKSQLNFSSTRWALAIYVLLNILFLLNFKIDFVKQYDNLISIAFNLFFFLGTLWLIYIGNKNKDGVYINLGFFFFIIGIIARYFDTFWTLLNRSFFFMLGGLLLIVGSYFVEKYRRPLIQKIHQHSLQDINSTQDKDSTQ